MKKKKKFNKIKFLLFAVLTIYIYINTLKLLDRIDLDIKNDFFYKLLINNSSSLSSDALINYEKFKEVINFKPNQLLNNNLIYSDTNRVVKVNNEEKKEDKEKVTLSEDMVVYIYNTHQTEAYSNEYLADYSITPNVMITSYMLKENLEEYGINSYVEEESVQDVLNKNSWSYSKSYAVSRSFMEKRVIEMPTFKYFIDLHRDSVKGKYTTVEIDGISYAKIMMIVGLDQNNYKENLAEAEKINQKINDQYPSLSRGIYKKSGAGVNGIYNQDFSKYVFLFEIGGVDNNISEVNNTITVLAKILAEYIKEDGDNDKNI